MTKTDVIREYVIENEAYTVPSRTLAKQLLNAHPKVFGEYNDVNIDKVRNLVRFTRYSLGDRKNKEDKLFAERFHGFTEPEFNDYRPYVISEEITVLGILNDIHFPFQNKKNLEAAINHLKESGVNGILLNGDIIDCYKGSSFLKDPRQRNLLQEFDILREFIDHLNVIFDCPIIYKLGNHEERIENMVLSQVPELVHFLTFEDCLRDRGDFDFNDYKLTLIKDKRIIKFTKNLNLLHGHEYRTGMFNPVGIARWLYMKARTNAACGHGHKVDSFAARNLNAHTIGTWSIGCLCDMTPKYMPLNDWQSGFAIVRRDGDNFKFSNFIIEDGRVM